jgi:biotin carboxyl carrier protein
MQKLPICLLAERRIPRRAQDQAVPRLIHRTRRHPDHLMVPQRGCTASQPLAQSGVDKCPRLPRTRFEHRRGKLKLRHRGIHPIEATAATRARSIFRMSMTSATTAASAAAGSSAAAAVTAAAAAVTAAASGTVAAPAVRAVRAGRPIAMTAPVAGSHMRNKVNDDRHHRHS